MVGSLRFQTNQQSFDRDSPKMPKRCGWVHTMRQNHLDGGIIYGVRVYWALRPPSNRLESRWTDDSSAWTLAVRARFFGGLVSGDYSVRAGVFYFAAALLPQRPCKLQRIYSTRFPEQWLVANLVKLTMMTTTQGDGVFVTDFASKCTQLGKS